MPRGDGKMNKNRVRIGSAAGILVVLFFLVISARAQEQDDILGVDERLADMKTALNLTRGQADAVKPIIEEFAAKRQKFRADSVGQVMIDNNAIRKQMAQFREEENQKLSEVLTKEQMKQWSKKQEFKDFLNRGRAIDTEWEPKGSGVGPALSF